MTKPREFLEPWVPSHSRRAVLMAILLFGSVFSYVLISRLIIDRVGIDGDSMNPGLRDGDMYMLHRYPFLFGDPARGDIVSLRDPMDDKLSVKRVIGVPGDTVSISGGRITLNGTLLDEPYLNRQGSTHTVTGEPYQVTLGEDQYLVLGDNRHHSLDSRVYGPVAGHRLQGKIRPP